MVNLLDGETFLWYLFFLLVVVWEGNINYHFVDLVTHGSTMCLISLESEDG